MDDYNYEYQQPESQKAVVRDELAAHNGRGNGMAVTSLVLGIISLVFCWGCGITLITSLIGLIFGIISLVQKRQSTGIAIAGVVTSGIGMLFGIIAFIFTIFLNIA